VSKTRDDRLMVQPPFTGGMMSTATVSRTTVAPTAALASASDAPATAASSTTSLASFCTLTTLRDSQPVSGQPIAKKLRMPPPSPSLLSTSSGSPAMSPTVPLPVQRPVTTHASHASSQHSADTRMNLQVAFTSVC